MTNGNNLGCITLQNMKGEYMLLSHLKEQFQDSHKVFPLVNDDDIIGVFKDESENYWGCSIGDLVESGTPIDANSGDDMQYLGIACRSSIIQFSI